MLMGASKAIQIMAYSSMPFVGMTMDNIVRGVDRKRTYNTEKFTETTVAPDVIRNGV